MAGTGGHNSFKHFLHIAMMVFGMTVLPATMVLFLYSVSAMILLGQWHFFLWSTLAFFLAIVFFVVIAIAAE